MAVRALVVWALVVRALVGSLWFGLVFHLRNGRDSQSHLPIPVTYSEGVYAAVDSRQLACLQQAILYHTDSYNQIQLFA